MQSHLKFRTILVLIIISLLSDLSILSAQSNFIPPPPPLHEDGDFLAYEGGQNRKFKNRKEPKFPPKDPPEDSDEIKNELLSLVKEQNIELYNFLIQNIDNDSPLGKRLTQGLFILGRVLKHQGKRADEIFNTHLEELNLERVAYLYHTEKSPVKKAELKMNLQERLTKLFDQKELIRKKMITDLETNLIKQKNEWQRRQNKKGKIIERRLDNLLNDNDEAEW